MDLQTQASYSTCVRSAHVLTFEGDVVDEVLHEVEHAVTQGESLTEKSADSTIRTAITTSRIGFRRSRLCIVMKGETVNEYVQHVAFTYLMSAVAATVDGVQCTQTLLMHLPGMQETSLDMFAASTMIITMSKDCRSDHHHDLPEVDETTQQLVLDERSWREHK